MPVARLGLKYLCRLSTGLVHVADDKVEVGLRHDDYSIWFTLETPKYVVSVLLSCGKGGACMQICSSYSVKY